MCNFDKRGRLFRKPHADPIAQSTPAGTVQGTRPQESQCQTPRTPPRPTRSPGIPEAAVVPAQYSTTTVTRKRTTRKRPTLANVMMLADWLATHASGVRAVGCIRTSDTSSKNFATMFDLGTRMRTDDPDFAKLRKIGVELVQQGGEELRRERGVLRTPSRLGRRRTRTRPARLLRRDRPDPLHPVHGDRAQGRPPRRDGGPDPERFHRGAGDDPAHAAPGVLYTPLVSRVFRNMDFASQVTRTLRDLNIRLHAEGQDVVLHGDEGITGLLKSWFSAREADAIVSRLDSIEKNIYADGDWYLGEHLLPFTWRLKSRIEIDALTGESRRVVVSKRDLEVVPGSAEVLRWFIREGAKRDVTNERLGVGLGQRGVRSRAPQHAPDYPTLDRLNNPANGASTLMAEKWRTAWRTGVYRRSIQLKADLRPTLPELSDRISEVEHEDGSVTLFLDVETVMPSPDGGWGITKQEWEDFEAVRFEPTPHASAGPPLRAAAAGPWPASAATSTRRRTGSSAAAAAGAYYHLLRVPRDAVTRRARPRQSPRTRRHRRP